MCSKIAYGYRAAHEALGWARGHHRSKYRKKIPKRAYYCEECKQWHLTSQKVEDRK